LYNATLQTEFWEHNVVQEAEAKRYQVLKIVGAGREGAVAVALDLETQELVAIKKVLNLFRHTSFTQMVRNEIKVMDLLKGSGEAPSFTAATLRSIPLHNQRALRTCPAADPTAHVLFWGHGFEAAMKPVCSLVLQRM